MTKREEYFKNYRAEHKAEIKAYEAERYKRNRARILARNNKWNAEHKVRIREVTQQWAVDNPERRKQIGIEWRKANPEKDKAIWHRRQTKKRQAGGSFSADEWQTLCKHAKHKCLCCGKRRKLEADHVVPVAHGGTSYITNIQPLCRRCNAKKGTKHTDYREGNNG